MIDLNAKQAALRAGYSPKTATVQISIQIRGDIDLSKVEPYQGKIVLGPEIFEELRGLRQN
ncbi:hypothetical protein CHY08_22875 (plasmid) [Rhizobium leguminosarum bv. viciae]|nr:hypothetical protein CHY08_22875 [Rhizobium leguminosarum bv. viciae]NKM98603.1 hypothetical protein [Rhizobium leguminosarum bv. viciae]